MLWLLILALVGLVFFSAFFSGSETALMSSGRIRLIHLAEDGVRGARRALELVREPGPLLATILVGNNLVNVMAAAIATWMMGPVWATLAVTLVLLVFAEVTPKTLAAHQPERFACRVAGAVRIFQIVLQPLVWVTSGLGHLLLWPVLGGQSRKDRRFTRQELMTAIRLGERDGILEPAETRMAKEILLLRDTPVSAMMIPINDVDGIPETASLDAIYEIFRRTENTRYPVYRKDLSDIVGLLLVKEVLLHQEGARENWRQYVRPMMRCQGDLDADELLRDMQIQGMHMALVEDASGVVQGIVTMEDILEEVFGEIQDELDDEAQDTVREVRPWRYLVRRQVVVDDLCKLLNIDLGQADQEITLGEWFERRVAGPAKPGQRVWVGPVRILRRSGSRFDILVKKQLLKDLRDNHDLPRPGGVPPDGASK